MTDAGRRMRFSPRLRVGLALGLLLALGVPPLSGWWEAALVRHMLAQIPLLLLAGALVGPLLWTARPSGPGWQQSEGVAAVLVGLVCLAFWMLPRWLDAAVVSPWVNTAKILSLPLLGGIPLGWGWARLGAVARGFVWTHIVTMFAVLGALYLAWPERLCNNYLASEQMALGHGSLAVAAALGLGGALLAVFGGSGGVPRSAARSTARPAARSAGGGAFSPRPARFSGRGGAAAH